jgi:hypothetical protein
MGRQAKLAEFWWGETACNIATQKRGEVINLYGALCRSRLYGQESGDLAQDWVKWWALAIDESDGVAAIWKLCA